MTAQSKNTHPLLGKHKPSQEWYTPDHIWNKVHKTFDCGFDWGGDLFDPCAFVLLYPHSYFWSREYQAIKNRFCEQFSDLGTIQLTRQVYNP